MAGVRGAPLWTIVIAWCAGCGVDDVPPRGFDAQQILSVRDPQLRPAGFTRDESKVYMVRYIEPPSVFGTYPPYDLSTLALETGEQQPVAPAVFSTVRTDGGPERGRTLALLHYPSAADVPAGFTSLFGPKPGHLVLSLVDETNGRRVDVSDVADTGRTLWGTSSAFDPIAVDRFDAAGNVHLWFGPPDTLRPASDAVGGIVGFDERGALAGTTVDGLTATRLEIRHLPFDGGEAAVVVTSALGEHTAIADESGEAVAPEPDLGGPYAPRYSCAPGPSAQSSPRCFLAYTRAGTPGRPSRLFVRLLDDPRERVLPGLDPSPYFLDATVVLWTAQGSAGNRLYSWIAGAERAAGCDVPPGTVRAVLWNAAHDRFALNIGDVRLDGVPLPGQLILGVPGGACRVITPAAQYYSGWSFSSDGTVLIWNEEAANGDTVIHLTATDGSGDRVRVVPGYIYYAQLLPGDQRLLIRRRHTDGTSLSWIDLADEPVRDHVLADRIAATFAYSNIWINDRWLLLGDALSAQDDTFTLRAVDVVTGTSRLVSRAVTDFAVSWSVPPLDATSLRIAYLVRGRAPSAQDGLWLARLDLDDFPI